MYSWFPQVRENLENWNESWKNQRILKNSYFSQIFMWNCCEFLVKASCESFNNILQNIISLKVLIKFYFIKLCSWKIIQLKSITLHNNIPKIYLTACERHELKDWRSHGKVFKKSGKKSGKSPGTFFPKICGNPGIALFHKH